MIERIRGYVPVGVILTLTALLIYIQILERTPSREWAAWQEVEFGMRPAAVYRLFGRPPDRSGPLLPTEKNLHTEGFTKAEWVTEEGVAQVYFARDGLAANVGHRALLPHEQAPARADLLARLRGWLGW